MNVAIVTSVSANIAAMATLTVPNKLEYCLRHGYTLIADNMPYDLAVSRTDLLCHYLDRFDLVWTLDCDAVVTNMAVPVHKLECLGPHVTVCEEGIVAWNRINCGSVVWRDTREARGVLNRIAASRSEWDSMPCQWQTWMGFLAQHRPDIVTVAPLRAFNSCAWNKPGGGEGPAGSHWRPGDLVYHPCGVFPQEEKLKHVESALQQVQQ